MVRRLIDFPTVAAVALALVFGAVRVAQARQEVAVAEWLSQARLVNAEATGVVDANPGHGVVRTTFPGVARLENLMPLAKDAGLPGVVEMEVFIPGDMPVDLWLAAYAKDKDGIWFQAPPTTPWKAGEWQTLRFDFQGASIAVQAAGHGAVWNANWARHMTEVGLQLFSSSPWIGEVRLGSVRLVDEPVVVEPRILDFRMLSRQPSAWDMLEFEFTVPGDFGNPFDPNDIRIDAVFTTPGGDVRIVPAFYHQGYRRYLDAGETEHVVPDGAGAWRVRMTPFVSGLYTWRIEGHVRGRPLRTRDHSLDVAPGEPRGFVRVSPKDPLFFESADGEFFYGIGHNVRSPTDERSSQKLKLDLPPDRGTFAYDHFFERLSAAGGNAGMVWMCNWWVSIEWSANWRGFHGINDYHLGNAWKLDRVLDEARRRGIHIYLDLDNHGKYSTFSDAEWQTSPFNSKNGGPCDSPMEMFSREDMFDLYARRIRYITARWGAYPNLIGWNLISEIDITGDQGRRDRNSPELFQWIRDAADLIHELDTHGHVVGTQWSGNWSVIYPRMAALEELDIIAGDSYKGANQCIVDLLIETAKQLSQYGKPYFTAEFGGSWAAASHSQLRADFHAGIWSNAMTVNAMVPMFWWFDFIDREELYSRYNPLALYLADWDPRGRSPRTVHTGRLTDAQGVEQTPPVRAVLLYMDDTEVNGWVYDRQAAMDWPGADKMPSHSGVILTVTGLADGACRVEYWDTMAGGIIFSEGATVEHGAVELALPPFSTDVAFKIRRP